MRVMEMSEAVVVEVMATIWCSFYQESKKEKR